MAVREIVDRFGGQAPLARKLDKGPSTVAYWVKHDTIPAKWHARLLALAKDEGIPLAPKELARTYLPVPVSSDAPTCHYSGVLLVDEMEIRCYVLSDGRRVISRTGAVEFLIGPKGGGKLESYLDTRALEAFIPSDWKDELVEFTIPEVKNKKTRGLRAETFLDICRAFVVARDATDLTPEQIEIAKRAGAFLNACATVGLIALIDEATGWQYDRPVDALQFKLKLFLEEEMRKWEKTFPDELWIEFGRLTGWTDPIHSRPKYWGTLVMELVYGYLDPDVAAWLKENAPKARHGQNYHQWMSEQYGLQRLVEHIWMLIGVASTCTTMPQLRATMAYRHGKVPFQYTLFVDPPRGPN